MPGPSPHELCGCPAACVWVVGCGEGLAHAKIAASFAPPGRAEGARPYVSYAVSGILEEIGGLANILAA